MSFDCRPVACDFDRDSGFDLPADFNAIDAVAFLEDGAAGSPWSCMDGAPGYPRVALVRFDSRSAPVSGVTEATVPSNLITAKVGGGAAAWDARRGWLVSVQLRSRSERVLRELVDGQRQEEGGS